jgi:hypothetical protein
LEKIMPIIKPTNTFTSTPLNGTLPAPSSNAFAPHMGPLGYPIGSVTADNQLPTFDEFQSKLASGDMQFTKYGKNEDENTIATEAYPKGTVVAGNPGADLSKIFDPTTGNLTVKPATAESISKDNIAAVVSIGGSTVNGPSWLVVYKDGTGSTLLPGSLENGIIGRTKNPPPPGQTGGGYDQLIKADGTKENTPAYDPGSSNFFGKIAGETGRVVDQNPFIVPLAFAEGAAAAEGGLSALFGGVSGEGGSTGLESAISGTEVGAANAGEFAANNAAAEAALNASGALPGADIYPPAGQDAPPGFSPPGGDVPPGTVPPAAAPVTPSTPGGTPTPNVPTTPSTPGLGQYLPLLTSAGAAIGSAVIGANAAGKAADATTNAANQASATQLQMFEEGRADTAPWRKAGETALNTLSSKIATGPGDYTSSPGYAFRTAEGQKAIERSAAAKGNVLSPATSKTLTRFGQDYATGDYQNFLANYYQSLTPYQSLAGVGQTTAMNTANQGNQVGASIGANTIAAGNAQAGGAINTANAITGAANSGINNYLMWQYLNQAKTPSAVAPTSTTVGLQG